MEKEKQIDEFRKYLNEEERSRNTIDNYIQSVKDYYVVTTEKEKKNFDKMIQEKSAVYISHRLSSTRFCDVIAMFVAGEMVEYGTHEELLAKGGAYSEMFNIQAQYYKEGEKEHEEIC